MMAVFTDGTAGHLRRRTPPPRPGITVALDIVATRSLADPAHSRFIFWDWDGRVRAFGPDGKPTDPSFDLPNPIFTLGISRDGTTLVTVFADYGLVAFDIATGEQVAGPVAGIRERGHQPVRRGCRAHLRRPARAVRREDARAPLRPTSERTRSTSG